LIRVAIIAMGVTTMKWLIPAVVSLGLAACSTGPGGGYKQPAGTLLGAAGGGLAGAQFGSGNGKLAATAAGALLGALVGNEVGGSLDRADAAYGRGYSSGYGYPSAGYAPRHSRTVTPYYRYRY
jgi:hypothetical protein